MNTRNPGLLLVVIGILLCVLTYGIAYKIGVAALLVGVLFIILDWAPWREPRA